MMQQISLYLTSIILGIMLFFSFVVAPVTFTALDEENMEGFIRMLELIKVNFNTVLLISHLDSLKVCVDMQIVIDKKSGYARVNQ